MSGDDPATTVRSGYDAAASRYLALERAGERWPRASWLGELTAHLEPGAAVLDLGCATGVPVAVELAKNGFQVTGVDIAPKHIELASTKVPDGEFVCADARTVSFPADRFDAAISLYTFDHIPREEHQTLLERVHGWLSDGGWLLLSIEDVDQPGIVAEWLGVDMHFSMFDADTTRRLVREAGFVIEKTSVQPQLEGGVECAYTWILASKAGSGSTTP